MYQWILHFRQPCISLLFASHASGKFHPLSWEKMPQATGSMADMVRRVKPSYLLPHIAAGGSHRRPYRHLHPSGGALAGGSTTDSEPADGVGLVRVTPAVLGRHRARTLGKFVLHAGSARAARRTPQIVKTREHSPVFPVAALPLPRVHIWSNAVCSNTSGRTGR